VNKVVVHSDGGARGNPGPAAIGVVVLDENSNVLETFSQYVGEQTNNTAEYLGLVKALQLATKFTTQEVHVFMDSELVINQVNGTYKLKAVHLQPFLFEVKRLEGQFARVVYTHVLRQHQIQSQADALVNEALDTRTI
jgi:ribonuclease HI